MTNFVNAVRKYHVCRGGERRYLNEEKFISGAKRRNRENTLGR